MPFPGSRPFHRRLKRLYAWYTLGFAVFIAGVSIGENMGLSARAIGYLFLMATIAVYSGIGVISRTADVNEYYV
ncbi:MAG: cation acetate symporter, partial [Rhodocyclales bacterium]|nr:cation acetate symporter [Rhodocyclales bacterium]